MNELFKFFYIGETLREVMYAIAPIIVFFITFQFLFVRMPRQKLVNLFKGILLSVVGLTLFLQGVKVGYGPVGKEMGHIMSGIDYSWITVVIGFFLGLFAAVAEPAVRILCQEVEKASAGAVTYRFVLFVMALGVGGAVALAMGKIVYGIPVGYIVIPGYILALVLLLFCHSTFSAIAFDGGGVATGPMTVSFVLAVAVGLAQAMEGRTATFDAFGLIALVALAPILTLLTFGTIYSVKGGIRNE